jgi:hypothetical protein
VRGELWVWPDFEQKQARFCSRVEAVRPESGQADDGRRRNQSQSGPAIGARYR